ncbi:hypothetical protein HYFRA_00008527 [Hymenoscyphus fraxineus]|uniref:LIM zinc-binding domain-containing protein n=1 Tax=Hymenoscyphus fraxineus TaxID=746836 RepID=A0A9N9KZJ8_9HELO|nr:hypothetical protein HYFRA_00008527 [Hymenoscyphus fraxineus]
MAIPLRQSSFLPTIKCSMCAKDIEISKLGDHICIKSGEQLTPPQESSESFEQLPPPPRKQTPTNGPNFLKPSRAMPPRVDTSAANRPFRPPGGQLTPNSASPSRYGSPNSPFGRPKGPLRSATMPISRAPPSPEILSGNLDCAFPPFPKKQQPKYTNRQGGGSGQRRNESNRMYAPVSPRTATSGGLLEKMNTIAPGPFDINRQKPEHKAQTKPPAAANFGHRRQGTEGSLKDMKIPSQIEVAGTIVRPSTAGGHARKASIASSTHSRSGSIVPKVPTNTGYGGFGPPSDEIRAPLNRSQTSPLENTNPSPPVMSPAEPRSASTTGKTSPDMGAKYSFAPNRKASPTGPDLSRPLPPRGASLIRPRVDTKVGEMPQLPDLNLAAEFGIGNPYHTPTESQSSDASGFSEESKASSRSSPPRSVGSAGSRRQPSDVSQMDVLMADLEFTMSDLSPVKLSPESSPINPIQERRESPTTSPVEIRTQSIQPLMPQPNIRSAMPYPSSQADPAIKEVRLPPIPQDAPRSTNGHMRKPTVSKGKCKGCDEVIKGKSISSADGRLTGRYHKHCFVCRTCSEPFQTSTFYVINDAPYCERHYHKLNDSVCTRCDKGIEGQFLQTEKRQKYHPECLTCADCNRNLKHDYFEMNGRVYCERDAFRRTQQQPRFLGATGVETNRMERRTTRLMMMG